MKQAIWFLCVCVCVCVCVRVRVCMHYAFVYIITFIPVFACFLHGVSVLVQRPTATRFWWTSLPKRMTQCKHKKIKLCTVDFFFPPLPNLVFERQWCKLPPLSQWATTQFGTEVKKKCYQKSLSPTKIELGRNRPKFDAVTSGVVIGPVQASRVLRISL